MDIGSNASLAEVHLGDRTLDDIQAAIVHLEDLEVFVGQRSRLHPGPGWDIALDLVRRDLALLQAELARRPDRPRAAIVISRQQRSLVRSRGKA